ncbi:MAG: hypothetical protein KBA81_00630 [Rhabdochlamydiaceae bacterium]|nr:hypothetical protein [Rhabdochlamydiaceae bacterium]
MKNLNQTKNKIKNFLLRIERRISLHKIKIGLLTFLILFLTLFGALFSEECQDFPSENAWKKYVLESFITDLQDQAEHFHIPEDLTCVAHSYEVLAKACQQIVKMNSTLTKVIKVHDFVICSKVILGLGDCGTTLWLEKFKSDHQKVQKQIELGNVPEILMIGETFGCWKHDYTLAQPYNLLERGMVTSNPSAYLFQPYYLKNPYANARHVFQANLVSLAQSEAPLLLGVRVFHIERKGCLHDDWQSPNHDLRLIAYIGSKQMAIYTHEINICTGLGSPRDTIFQKCNSLAEFNQLSKFDQNLDFTPLVDGDQYVFTNSQEKSSKTRTIVVYGGGGTAAACYRKAFFGHDRKKSPNSFENQKNQNKVFWFARDGFEAAGNGKLATSALETARKREELSIGELNKISQEGGRLKLNFTRMLNGTDSTVSEVICDQLIYAIGQDSMHLKQLCEEFEAELLLDIKQDGMPICVRTDDNKIHFFGAAAMAIRQKEYMAHTWEWLHQENIGPDVGPGSMPPSRAQIREYIAEMGLPIEAVNVNADSIHLIRKFLEQCEIETKKIDLFVTDILLARKDSTAGFSKEKLQAFLDKYELNTQLYIIGHSHLVKKRNT